ncbi:MAG: hypothetical protein M5U34_36875 [Chloroflexi bacterium]|nr:hypothetical protein [Chloroflexota bacterium]
MLGKKSPVDDHTGSAELSWLEPRSSLRATGGQDKDIVKKQKWIIKAEINGNQHCPYPNRNSLIVEYHSLLFHKGPPGDVASDFRGRFVFVSVSVVPSHEVSQLLS